MTLLWIELGLAVLTVPLALLSPRLGDEWFSIIEERASRIAAKRRLAVLMIFVVALGARLAMWPLKPIPAPGVHDEFSYLLMADTFAHGRITNPTHPMWLHFETFHVNQKPTYCSKYFPAQGLFLALGQAAFGHPFWGVWLSTGLMCAVICWALQGWMPAGWAFLGGVLVTLRLGVFSYWADSYWGGSVPAIGGALVFGAFPRIKRSVRAQDAILMALGIGILANSRPLEGLIYSLTILIPLAIWFFKKCRDRARWIRSVCLPGGMVLALLGVAMLYYFWRTTGSPFRSPYQVYSSTYGFAPLLPWERLPAMPAYNNAQMRDFYSKVDLAGYLEAHQSPLCVLASRSADFAIFFLGPALCIPMLVVLWILLCAWGAGKFSRKSRLVILSTVVCFCLLLLPIYFQLHYAAPITCSFIAVILSCMRYLWTQKRRGGYKETFIVRAAVVVCLIMFVVQMVASGKPRRHQRFFASGSFPGAKIGARAKISKDLQQQGVKQLVIVRYRPEHDLHDEWVYNGAKIDESPVVWARELSPAQDKELLSYFKDRRVWLLDGDAADPTPVPYAAAIESASKR